MEVSCPNCYTSYTVSPEKVPEKGVTPTCKKCGTTFTIVKATGDPLKDRANRMKGYVVLRESSSPTHIRGVSNISKPDSDEKATSASLFEKKGFRVGVCVAAAVILFFTGGFFGWKYHVHRSFEDAVKSSLQHTSNRKFAMAFEDMTFSAFGGLTSDKGCIHGLSLTDQQTQKRLTLADEIHFKLDYSKKQFVTAPFDVQIKNNGLEIALYGCVIEAQEAQGWSVAYRVDQASAGPEGFPLFLAQGMEMSLDFRGENWAEDSRFVMGDADLGFKVEHMGSVTTTVGKDLDILVSIKNGLFVKDEYDAEMSTGNYFNAVATKWGNLGTVLSLERCSANILGSSVRLAGKLAFHNPVGESEMDLHLGAKDFSHIMKYIHETNQQAFDRIVSALVALDEREADAYENTTDVLDLNLSYRNSRIEINNQAVKNLI
jgi:predicted Zn finger-like uncharacterized protein